MPSKERVVTLRMAARLEKRGELMHLRVLSRVPT
jgi:hypothetical protein